MLIKQLSTLALGFLALGLASCSDNNATPTPDKTYDATGNGGFLLSLRAPSGTEYVLQTAEIENKNYHVSQNFFELPNVHYAWVFNGKTAIGMSYQQDQPGVGYGFRLQSDKTLKKTGEFLVTNRFTNYEFLDENTLVTSVAGQVSADSARNDGATFCFWNVSDEGVRLHHRKTIWTEDITGNGEQVTFSGIVPWEDGTFLTAMVQSSWRERNPSNGGSSVGVVKYPDSCWVAQLDTALNVKRIFRDNRISYISGRYRAMMFRSLLKTDDGTVYAFSNAYEPTTTLKAGALRINKGATEFDPTYYFDLQTPANDYKFRRVWYVTGHTFLLEIYNDHTVNIMSPGHQFALVDMQNKAMTFLKGIPNKVQIISGSESGGHPLFYKGFLYLPLTTLGEDAKIYKVDLSTASATVVTTVTGVEEIRSLGFLE